MTPDGWTPGPSPWTLVLWALAMLGAWCWLTGPAHGQDPATMLARTCVSEAGWSPGADCPAIAAVARWRARAHHDGDLRAALRALSPRLHGSPCSVTRGWLCDLDPDGHRPAGLGAPWVRVLPSIGSSRRDAWLAVLVTARALVDVPAREPCAVEPHAWGSGADLRRRALAGYLWRETDCGPTRNHFGRLLVRAVDPD
mgnify:CR=1 FL=1